MPQEKALADLVRSRNLRSIAFNSVFKCFPLQCFRGIINVYSSFPRPRSTIHLAIQYAFQCTFNCSSHHLIQIDQKLQFFDTGDLQMHSHHYVAGRSLVFPTGFMAHARFPPGHPTQCLNIPNVIHFLHGLEQTISKRQEE